MNNKNELSQQRNRLLSKIEEILEVPMTFLGFVWLVLLVVELIKGLSPLLTYISVTIWVLFIIDFILKFMLAPEKWDFLKKNWLTVISLIVPALRLLRVVRFVRVLRSLRSVNLIKVVSSVNRSMNSLNATMKRRGFLYVLILTVAVGLVGAAGMFAFENKVEGGLSTYSSALWWTFMVILTMGSEYWPQTPEGRFLCFMLALYGFAVFGYITATIASFFVGRDAEEKDAPIASTEDIESLRKEIQLLTKAVHELSVRNESKG